MSVKLQTGRSQKTTAKTCAVTNVIKSVILLEIVAQVAEIDAQDPAHDLKGQDRLEDAIGLLGQDLIHPGIAKITDADSKKSRDAIVVNVIAEEANQGRQ